MAMLSSTQNCDWLPYTIPEIQFLIKMATTAMLNFTGGGYCKQELIRR